MEINTEVVVTALTGETVTLTENQAVAYGDLLERETQRDQEVTVLTTVVPRGWDEAMNGEVEAMVVVRAGPHALILLMPDGNVMAMLGSCNRDDNYFNEGEGGDA